MSHVLLVSIVSTGDESAKNIEVLLEVWYITAIFIIFEEAT